MALKCGIVGLPNVGKSTIFSALTSAPAEAANYPFCTIDPNVGIVAVPDPRLAMIAEFIPPQKIIPASIEIVDIAGLVRGASKGEGRGNQFLANIRETHLIIHVVRCFDDPDIVHVDNRIDPAGDIETINIELALADLKTVETRAQKNEKLVRAHQAEAKALVPVLEALKAHLNEGNPARTLSLEDEERTLIKDLGLMTMKPQIFVCNVDEGGLEGDNDYVKTVKSIAAGQHSDVVVFCGKLESEIAALETLEERREFLESAGLSESGLDQLVRACYHTLGLRTYFTAGETEVRAWTFHEGNKAPACAGVIHTDFEKGFIKAEVYHCTDLFELKSEGEIRAKGKLRIEGKEYLVKDGDVMHFRFNV